MSFSTSLTGLSCSIKGRIDDRLERDLNALERHRCWTWDTAQRRWDAGSGKAQLPMWFVYHVELYPHFGQGTGVFDQYGHELIFPSLFRQSRYSAQEKGIVRVVR